MYLTAAKHGKIVQAVYLDECDVTKYSSEANTDEGWVVVWKEWPPKRINGQIVTETERLYGTVRVEFRSPAKEMLEAGGVLED